MTDQDVAAAEMQKKASNWAKWLIEDKMKTLDDQAEFFLFKFNAASGDADVSREKVIELKTEFATFDDKSIGELETDQALRLLEARNETKTYTELRELLKEIDRNHNNMLNLLEWLCAVFNKSWDKLNEEIEVDIEKIKEKLMGDALRQEKEAQQKAEEYTRARVESMQVKDRAAAEQQARLDEEEKLKGNKKKIAMFERIMEESQQDANINDTIKQQVKHEAEKRKQEKLIKKEEAEARKAKEEAEEKALALANEEMLKVNADKARVYEEEKARVAKAEEEKKAKEAEERAASRARLKERMKMFEQNS